MLYKQEKLVVARLVPGLPIIEFQHELAKRGLCITYDVEDFQADIETLRSMGRL